MNRSITSAQLTFCIGVFFAALLVLLTPPFQSADEDSHFKRSVALSELKVLPKVRKGVLGHYLPRAVADFEAAHRFMKSDQNAHYSWASYRHWLSDAEVNFADRVFVPYHTANSHPFLYLPQTLGIALGRLTGSNSPVVLLIAGRFVNLLFFWCCVFAAVRSAPAGKTALALLSLMPMTLSLSASLSYDAVVNGVTLLLIANLLRLAFDPEVKRVGWNQIALITLLAVWQLELKQVYYWVVLFWFLIPRSKFNSAMHCYGAFAIIVGAGLLQHLVWARLQPSGDFYPFTEHFHRQIRFILMEPFTYARIWIGSLCKGEMIHIQQFVGNLGWLDNPLPRGFVLAYSCALVAVALGEVKSGLSSLWSRGWMLAVVGLMLLSTSTAIYVTWTALPDIGGIGYPAVKDLQGRYLIPLAMTAVP
ncbi:MAG: DUF2142 domain-containing protein, partial [Desulfobacterales bacterium]|nr:DUF2142 domain-containing protein [Desulfobacterales bacterium]